VHDFVCCGGGVVSICVVLVLLCRALTFALS
jgi:hypothetical protein